MCWCPTRLVLPLIYIIASPGHKWTLWNYPRLSIFLLLDFDEYPTCSTSSSSAGNPLPPSLLTAALCTVPHLCCFCSSETLKSFTFCWILLLLLRSHANCHVPLMFRTVSLGFAFSSLQSHNILHFFWIILTNCQQSSPFLPAPKPSGHSRPRTQ